MESNKDIGKLSKEQIEQCIAILEALNSDTDQLFDIPMERRIELITQAGRLSRPQKDELNKRKKTPRKKPAKRQQRRIKFHVIKLEYTAPKKPLCL